MCQPRWKVWRERLQTPAKFPLVTCWFRLMAGNRRSDFRETMHLLKNTSRPLRLVLRPRPATAASAPPVQSSAALPRSGTSSMASESRLVTLSKIRLVVSQRTSRLSLGWRVQVIATATRANVCFWPWKQIAWMEAAATERRSY